MRKYKANSAVLWGIIGLVGTVLVGALALLPVFYNWSSVLKAEFDFPKNDTIAESEYYDIGGTRELTAWQTSGTSDCSYTCYRYTRNSSGYSLVFTGKTFSENNTLDGVTYAIEYFALSAPLIRFMAPPMSRIAPL